jgi:hypothetical protein
MIQGWIEEEEMFATVHPRGWGAARLQPPNPKKLKFNKHGFCRYYDIISFT